MATDDAVLAQRLASQMISSPAQSSVPEVVRRLLAVQAQDERGFRLAIRSRSVGLVAADVDRALNEGELVVTWLNRGTLHLVAAEDYRWLHPLLTPRIVPTNTRRLREEGVSAADADRGVEIIADAVGRGGPQTRSQLRTRLAEGGVPVAGQALVHVIVEASIRGQVVRGPIVDGHHAFVAAPTWVGEVESGDEPEWLRRLGTRYLAGHWPAGPGDLAKWAGISLSAARVALATVDTGRAVVPPRVEPRLLGAFDPVLHGWSSRDALLAGHPGVVTSNGIFRPVVLVDGRVIGTWALPDGVPTLRLARRVPGRVEAALRREAADVLRFLALPPRPAELIAP